ncbi:DEAD/DEAH box helicase [Bacillus velezensis]|uniref:DEAD/DEAH box helicase n=1 Tax=Bacillus TaxID=1386 RepID=UPI00040D5262|nr:MULTISPECIES: SNF2-related protein [Bacillus]AIU82461.1 RNA polymerase-associated protein RapA [Bacillus velezensis]ASK59060.1 ATP-dependent helicase [Bacillus velezensis]ATD73658.1 RNA polymerase-associated protein RapA [Bacillus velezensis]ATV23421.1 ATP-dependent helicase [Bacillus sp. Lzh-5]MVZ93396.1 ATP-dependent helicase [Bacillus velezensis]
MTAEIIFDANWPGEFSERLKTDGPWSNWEMYKLSAEVQQTLAIPEFEGLRAPLYLPDFTPLPHQLEVAQKVVEKMNGKAILADEVGLGKTVEAGLILKEYMIRGLAKKILILVPASLVSQWVKELQEKFLIPAVEQKKSYVWEQCDIVVSSIDTAKRSPHKDIVLSIPYDLVIIDEAHKLKNSKTKNYEFARSLVKKYCLLLTATPIQNRIEEIFNLVSLLKPGHLGNESGFQETFNQKDGIDAHEHLKELVNKVMIRNTRSDTGLTWTKRHVKTVPITFSPTEQALYDDIAALKNGTEKPASAFSIMTLQRECCSSREAVYMTLKKMLDQKDKHAPAFDDQTIANLMDRINQVTQNSKAIQVVDLIQKINDKVIIFTEYRATQIYLQWFLQQNGISSVPFRGGFKRGKKDWMKDLFRGKVQVLIATEAGGEGINLQFCNHIINYDLPWNPMRLEQRIGRIHRLGQERDVHIYNMATKHTVEEHILKLLYDKIHLFENVVGELDDILTKIKVSNFEDHLHDILCHSLTEEEMRIKMDNLTSFLSYGTDKPARKKGS